MSLFVCTDTQSSPKYPHFFLSSGQTITFVKNVLSFPFLHIRTSNYYFLLAEPRHIRELDKIIKLGSPPPLGIIYVSLNLQLF